MEVSQVPKAHTTDFHKKTGKRIFQYFNTNNLWFSLPAVKDLMMEDRLVMDPIDGARRTDGFVQLETPVGSAIQVCNAWRCVNAVSCGWRIHPVALCVCVPMSTVLQSFAKHECLLVQRQRFLPIKNTADLLSVQSNLFQVKHGGWVSCIVLRTCHWAWRAAHRRLCRVHANRLSSNETRLYRPIIPVVKLGPEFATIHNYHRRIPHIPDLRDLDHLTVSGDVRFGEGVVLKVRAYMHFVASRDC